MWRIRPRSTSTRAGTNMRRTYTTCGCLLRAAAHRRPHPPQVRLRVRQPPRPQQLLLPRHQHQQLLPRQDRRPLRELSRRQSPVLHRCPEGRNFRSHENFNGQDVVATALCRRAEDQCDQRLHRARRLQQNPRFQSRCQIFLR